MSRESVHSLRARQLGSGPSVGVS